MAMNDVEICEDTCIHAERLEKVRAGLPDEDELNFNPRARSAKLRVAERV